VKEEALVHGAGVGGPLRKKKVGNPRFKSLTRKNRWLYHYDWRDHCAY